ncbi:hypothetical protein [Enterobacter kobei]|uniref:hypothetical protein n=1 Tax=Enterobacter kobei TaxID=208224 RepID=UPI003A9788D5
MKSGVTTRVDNTQAILDALKSIGKKEVLVGIPEAASSREDSPFSNAGIGYVNEYGSPAQNIPPRPHLVPGVKSVEDQTVPALKVAAQAALAGKDAAAMNALNQAGRLAVHGVHRFIRNANFTPLADSTVEARARKGRKGAKAEMARRAAKEPASTVGAKPLYDTGKYRDAITHVVRDKDDEYF